MENPKLIIYGIGSFAEYVHYVLQKDSSYQVIGFTVENKLFSPDLIMPKNLPLIKLEEIKNKFSPAQIIFMIAVGSNSLRERLFLKIKAMGFSFGSYISSKAATWDNLQIGENTFISEDCGIQPFVTIGNNSILIGVQVGHHSTIGDNVLMSSCSMAGNVTIGDNSFLGLNSSIKEKVKIGKNNIIGMNAVITSDTKDNEIFTAPKALKRNCVRSRV